MDPSRVLPEQVSYWDSVAGEKRFWHPLCLAWLTRHIGSTARILDFGCGYGRTVADLVRAGYKNVIGVDFSFRMLACCRSQLPDVRLVQNYRQTIPLQKHSVNLVLLFAVLTCIPRNEDQRELLREIRRVLCPDGLLYISDLLLNDDLRNLERYDRYAEEYGTYGIFELPDGAVVRHHQKEWIEDLTTSFDQLEFEAFEATTMNGNKSAAFQYLGRSSTITQNHQEMVAPGTGRPTLVESSTCPGSLILLHCVIGEIRPRHMSPKPVSRELHGPLRRFAGPYVNVLSASGASSRVCIS